MKKNDVVLYIAGAAFFVLIILSVQMDQRRRMDGNKRTYQYSQYEINCSDSDFKKNVEHYRVIEKGRIVYREKMMSPQRFLSFKGICEVREKSQIVIINTCFHCKGQLTKEYQTEEIYSLKEIE